MKGYFRKRGRKWSFTLDLGTDPATGKRKQKTVSGFKTKREAQTACAELQKQINEETYIDEDNILFKDFAKEWLDMYAEVSKISTVRARENEVNRLLDYIAYIKLKDISQIKYQAILNDLKKKGYAPNTIAGVHSAARMIFKKAMEYELIKKNPTEYAKLPRKIETVEEIENQEKAIKFLEKEELIRFLKAATEKGLDQDEIVFPVLAYSGLRVGELLALKWKDVDFTESTINITKTIYNPKNRTKEYQLLSPKTKGSIRKIKMDGDIMHALKRHKAKQNELKMLFRDEYVEQDFVIAKPSGYPEFIKTVETRMKRLLKLAGINRHLTPHSLRHTHTSLLIEAGVGIKEIQQRLGHTDIETTMNIYAHMTSDMEEKASHKFSELMRSLN